MDEDTITPIQGWSSVSPRGHWHWEMQGDRPEIVVRAPMPGPDFSWNCQCSKQITHKITTDRRGRYAPGEPLFTHREW